MERRVKVRDMALRQVCIDPEDVWRTVFTWLGYVDSEIRWCQWDSLGLFFLVCGQIICYMNSEVYVNILDNNMFPTLYQYFGIDPFLYQHDNAPVHKAKAMGSWFEENWVDTMAWPGQSPRAEFHQTSLECLE